MKIEIAKQDDRMAPSGAAILRSLQNESLPVIDLVVRESFQNSLDARLPDKEFVHIDINAKKVKTENVTHHFKGITQNLNKKLPEETTVLSIADANTSGLTGRFKTNDAEELDRSNIYKLIYGINMNQEEGDAGGSWGLGKTSFFRIGAGIVIYYSRVKMFDGTFEDRLAACLIEDTKKENPIMPDNPRGVAWWGDKEDESNLYEKTYPITDRSFINKFLKDFHVKPYEDNNTGTTIIIPFINEDELIIKKDEHTLKEEVYWWESSLTESLEIAIKRWYAPRLMNMKYSEFLNQPYLVCKLNNSLLSINKNDSTFFMFFELYNAALSNSSSNEHISIKEIRLKRLGMDLPSTPIGRVAYLKINDKELRKTGGNRLSPLKYIGEYMESKESGRKILAYSRKPGMIIEYVVDDNEWMKGITTEEGEYVFAFFVPNSDGKLHERYLPRFVTLENYLRETENADHANWTDIYIDKNPTTIIKRIKAEVSKALLDDLGDSPEALSNRRTGTLSRKYGQMFMPKVGFGKGGSNSKKRNGENDDNSRLKSKSASISIVNFERDIDNRINVLADISLPKNTKYDFIVNVQTTDSVINLKQWTKTFKDTMAYPFEIDDLKLTSGESLSIITNKDNGINTTYTLENATSKNFEARISFILKVNDPSMRPILSLTNKESLN